MATIVVSEKTIHEVETQWLSSKEKVLDTVVSKESHADSLLEQEKIHYYWFTSKSCNCKQYFLLPTPEAKFTLFIKWHFCVCVCVCVCVCEILRPDMVGTFIIVVKCIF